MSDKGDKIDQRIVEMSFENKKFEKGISQSKNSLKEFSDALKNSGMDKDFSGLEKSVTSLSGSFSMLEQIGIGALRRIGEAAVDAGVKLFKSLSVDQLTAGWAKYEEKLDAVQTLVSAGYSMDAVRKEMEQLMWFSDETSYSFSDMANNMGKFVASGVELKTATKSMEGIATWAAISGKDSQAASIAMFNLSQAISTGYVDTLNWRSIMGQNMNTVMFKQVAIGVAEATGAIEKGQVTIQNFDSNLKTKWFTNDVLLKTLDQYANYAEKVREVQEEMNFDTASQAMAYMDQHAEKYGDLLSQVGNAAFKASQESKKFSDSINATMDAVSSEWLRTYEIIFGELDEAKKNFTALTEILWTVFASGAENRNEMLKWLKEAGGISNVFQGFKNIAISLLKILKPIAEAFDQIFPPKTREQWLSITEKFKEFTASLMISDEIADKIKRTFAGLFAVLDIGKQVLQFLGSAVLEIIKIFSPLGSTVLDTSANIGDFLVKLNNAIKSSKFFQYALLAVKVGVALLRIGISKLISGISEFITGLRNAENPLEYLRIVARRVFSDLVEGIKTVISWVSGKFQKAIERISNAFNGIFDISGTGVWPTILRILKTVVEFINSKAIDCFKNFGETIKNLNLHKITTFVVGGVLLIFVRQLANLAGGLGEVAEASATFIRQFKNRLLTDSVVVMLRSFALALGVLTASLLVLSKIPADDLRKALIGLAVAIGVFVAAYAVLQKIKTKNTQILSKDQKAISNAFGLAGFAATLVILATALKIIGTIDQDRVAGAVVVLGVLIGFIMVYQSLAVAISNLPSQNNGGIVILASMSATVLGLVAALAVLSLFSVNAIQSSLAKLAAILLVISVVELFFAAVARIGGGKKVSVNILSMAAGVAAMVGVMKLLSVISPAVITQGAGNLLRLGLLLSAVEAMMGLAGRISGGKKMKTNILMTQVGLLAMIGLIKLISLLTQEEIDRGVTTLAKMAGIIGGIELITAASARLAGGTKVQKILGTVTITLLAFTGIIALLGSVNKSVVDIDQGITVLTEMIGLIAALELVTAIASRASAVVDQNGNVSKTGGMFGALIGVSAAIITLTGSLILLSMIDKESLRGATESLAIASIAVMALAIGAERILDATNKMSKSSDSFGEKLKSISTIAITLIGLLGVTALFFGAFSLVSGLINPEEIEKIGIFTAALVAITGVITVIALSAKSFKTLGGKNAFKGIANGLAAMVGVIALTAGFFGAFSLVSGLINPEEIEKIGLFAAAMVVITGLMDVIAISAKSFKTLGGKNAFKGIANGLAAMVGVIALTAGFFGAFSLVSGLINPEEIEKIGIFAAALMVMTGLMGVIALFANSFKTLGAGGITALAGIGIAIVGVAAVVLAVVGLAELLNVMIKKVDNLTRGLDLLVEVGSGIGRFIGAIAAGFTSELLTGFGEGLAGFVNAFDGVSFDSLSGIDKLASAFLTITSASLLDGFNAVKNAIIGKSTLEQFAGEINKFVVALQDISPDDAQNASDIMNALTPMIDALSDIADVAKKLPNSGGWLGTIMGENDIDDFGSKLASLIEIFSDTAVYPITEDAADHAVIVIDALALMVPSLEKFITAAQKIPNSGGWLGTIMGENDINDFGLKIAALIGIFNGTSICPITERDADKAATVLAAMKPMADNLKSFARAAEKIPNSGGFLSSFLGTVDLPTFASQIQGLIETFGGVDQVQLKLATSTLNSMNKTMLPALTNFSDFTNGLKDSGGLAQLFSGNTTLSEFGKDLKKFIDKLSKADFDIIAPAMEAMAAITTSFETLGADVMDNAKESFENNKEPFQTSIATILDEPTKKFKDKKDDLVDAVSDVFKASKKEGQSYKKDFKTLGKNLIAGLKSGIKSEQDSAVTTIAEVLSALVEAAQLTVDAHSPSRVFRALGEWCGEGLTEGVSSQNDAAAQAGSGLSQSTIAGLLSSLNVGAIEELFTGIGQSVPTSVSEGFQNGKSALLDKAEALGIDTGNLTLKGLVSSVTGGEGGFTSGINSLLELLTGTTSDAAEDAGSDLGDTLADGFTDALGGLSGSATQEVVKSELDKLKSIIEEREFYGTITVEQELDLYQKLRDSYEEGSDERKQIDREIYTRLKTIYEAQLSYINGVSKAQKDAADERTKLETEYVKDVTDAQEEADKKLSDLQKQYDQDVIQEKADTDKKLQDEDKRYYDSLNSILDEAEQERQRLREEYASNQKSINDKLLSDIDAQNKAYEDAVKSRADALYSSYNLFDAVGEDEEVTGEELLKNLQDQGAALSEWKQNLAALSDRGVGDQLIEELQSMGPSSKAQIKALLSLTDDQLTEYVSLFEGKYAFARTKAEEELEGLKDSTAQTIQDLNAQAEIDLGNLEAEFNTSMADVNSKMASDMSDLRVTHNATLEEINADLRDKLTELQVTWEQSTSEVNADLVDKLNDLKSTYDTSLSKINTDLQENLEEMKTTFSTSMKEIAGLTEEQLREMISDNKAKLDQLNTDTEAKLNDIEKTYASGGSDIASSFGAGLDDISSDTASTLSDVKSAVEEPLNSVVSDFEAAGFNAAGGFASGIRNGTYQAIQAAKALAHSAVSAAELILDENSPSKVFEGIGKFVSMGFANGIVYYADQAEKASQKMANGSISVVAQALSEIEDSDDVTFTITPVLDLSAVHSSDISQLLNQPIQLGTTSSKLAAETIQVDNRKEPSTTIINKIDMSNLTIRQESDIDAVATKLYQKQQAAYRGFGQRVPARA